MKKLVKMLVFVMCIIQIASLSTVYGLDEIGNPIYKEFYVSPSGSDSASGLSVAPFKTIERAQEEVKKFTDSMTGDIIVNLEAGAEFYLDKTWDLDVTDSGKNGYNVIYRGDKDNMPRVSGGVKVTGFTRNRTNPNIWETTVTDEDIVQLRSIYVNNDRYELARGTNLINSLGDYDDPNTDEKYDGLYFKKEDLGIYENMDDVEMCWFMGWTKTMLHFDKIIEDPENSNQVIAVLQDPGFWSYTQIKWRDNEATNGRETIAYPSDYGWIQNAYELLDAPGEFYFDKETKILSMIPKADVDISNMEVILPKLDRLMRVYGNDVDDKVENITFDGIEFSHTENYSLSYGDSHSNQVTASGVDTNGVSFAYRGSVVLERTKNVNFINNMFFGFGGPGLHLRNGVEDSIVRGNVFSDIGSSSLVVGERWYGANGMPTTGGYFVNGTSPRPQATTDYNLINNCARQGFGIGYPGIATCYTSYWGGADTGMQHITIGDTYYDESLYDVNDVEHPRDGYWESDPFGPEKNEKAWVMYDFDKPRTISEVILRFDTDDISEELRSGYEVLLSNDREFDEGKYVTVATQTEAVEPEGEATVAVARYNVEDDTKYKFLMIRTLGATRLALTSVLALTPDIPNDQIWLDECKYIDVTNNYVQRSDSLLFGGPGIAVYFASQIKLLHNEVCDNIYSGISFGYGWGWSDEHEHNSEVAYNYIHNISRFADDGGAIYTLGHQRGTSVHDNWGDSIWQSRGTFYPDQGSSYMTWYNNVATNDQRGYYQWDKQTSEGNTFYDNYTGLDNDFNLWAEEDWVDTNGYEKKGNNLEKAEVFLAGNLPAKAYAITKQAGLEDEFKHIKALAPEGDLNIPNETGRFISVHNREYVTAHLVDGNDGRGTMMIESGRDGIHPGSYPYENIFRLKETKAKYDAGFVLDSGEESPTDRVINPGDISVEEYFLFYNYRKAVQDAAKSVVHLELSEMIKYCEDHIASSQGVGASTVIDESKSLYPEDALNTFVAKVSEVKEESASLETVEARHALVIELEDALIELERGKMNADVEAFYVSGAERTEIDKENKTIKVYFNELDRSKEYNVGIAVPKSATVSDITKMSFNTVNQISVYSPATEESTVWTVTAEEILKEDDRLVTPDSFVVDMPETEKVNGILPMIDGSVMLSANYHPYMSVNTNRITNSGKVKFNPGTEYKDRSFTFILGAKTAENFDYYEKSSDFDRLELTYKSGKMSLSAVNEGITTELAETNVSLNDNSANVLEYSVEPTGENNAVRVMLNGVEIFDETTDMSFGEKKYLGYYSTNVNMQILPQSDELSVKDISVSKVSGENNTYNIKADISFVNISESAKSAEMIIAAYKESQLVYVRTLSTGDVPFSNDALDTTVKSLTTTKGFTESDLTFKVMVWDNITNALPISKSLQVRADEIN